MFNKEFLKTAQTSNPPKGKGVIRILETLRSCNGNK